MLITVIIPVYNAEKYLAACIDSVLAQSMHDFELLLVDDGSTDGSGATCDRYAALDGRIRVFHAPNRGASAARNLGLDNAQGEFIVFVDSDDRILPGHLQQFADSRIGEDGIAFTNLLEERPERNGTPRIRTYAMPDRRVTDGGHKACMPVLAELLRKHCFGWTWNKMFSRATIERTGLRFDEELRYAEDEVFTARYCAHITHIVTNSNPTYYYRFVPGSLLRGGLDPLMLTQTRTHINRLYEKLGYSDEVLYITGRTLFSRLRRELRHSRGWNSDITNILAESLLNNWKALRRYARPEFYRTLYDQKVRFLGKLVCAPDSRFWVKLIIRGLHQ